MLSLCCPCLLPLLCWTDLDDKVAKHWAAFGAAGKDKCTVSDLLKCKSGVEAVLPAKFSTYTSFTRDNFPNVCKEIAAAEPIYLRTSRQCVVESPVL